MAGFGITFETNNYWANTGNSWGAPKLLGNIDNFPLYIITDGTNRIIVSEPTDGRTWFEEGITTRSGSAAADSAPIKIRDGSLNTVPEDGAIEWTDNNGLFITQGTERYGIGAMGSSNGNNNWISGKNQLNTSVGGSYNIVFGVNPALGITTGAFNTVVGGQITGLLTGSQNVIVGNNIQARNASSRSVLLGSDFLGSKPPGDRNVWIGSQISTSITSINVVAIGNTTYTLDPNTCIIGGGNGVYHIPNFYFGGSKNAQGVYDDNGQLSFVWSIPERYKLVATADMAAHQLVIKGSLGTGDSAGGNIIFQTQDTGLPGTTLRNAVTRLSVLGGTGDIQLHQYPNTRNDFAQTRKNQLGTNSTGVMISQDAYMQPITVSELIAKRDASELIVGNFYQITDSTVGLLAAYADSASTIARQAFDYGTGSAFDYDLDADTATLVYQVSSDKWGVFGTTSSQGAAIADASGGTTVDAEARTAINDLLAVIRGFGFIAP